MTGFGRSQTNCGDKVISVDIRSLNSKYLDINLRLPHLYKEKEPDIRKLLGQKLKRGKVDLSVNVQAQGQTGYAINRDAVIAYYNDIQKLPHELLPNSKELLPALLNLPDSVAEQQPHLHDEEWQALQTVITEALNEVETYRTNEGKELKEDFLARVNHIENGLEAIKETDPGRKEDKRAKLQQLVEDYVSSDRVDETRLEQELAYYLEKLDINEEIVRLANHCDYFRQVLEEEGHEKGKKLNFISQEMGREINTIGSKSNDTRLQKHVVEMKQELEKIKEQVHNIV